MFAGLNYNGELKPLDKFASKDESHLNYPAIKVGEFVQNELKEISLMKEAE